MFRESEIKQLYNTSCRDEDVRRLQIAMNDSFGVRGFQRCRDLSRYAQGLSRGKSVRLFTGNNRSAVNALHNNVVGTDIVNLADVGVIQRRDGFGFTLKSLAELRAGNFDRDEAIQPRVLSAVHFSHAARADGREDFVRAEFVAGRKLHMTVRAESSPLQSGKGAHRGAPGTWNGCGQRRYQPAIVVSRGCFP